MNLRLFKYSTTSFPVDRVPQSINAILSFIQEKKADESISELNKMFTTFCYVLRDGKKVKINAEDLENYLSAYQTKKTLNMDEICNIGIFLQICMEQVKFK